MRQKSEAPKRRRRRVSKDIRRATRQAIFCRGEDPHRAGGPARRGQHRRAVPPRGHRPEPCIMAGPRSSWRPARGGLAGDTARAATSDEVKDLRREASALKEVVAEQALEIRLLKKSMIADGGDEA